MAKRALIVWGGWKGHQPRQVADIFSSALKKHGFEVEISCTLDAFLDDEKIRKLNLMVPVWTMGTLEHNQEKAVLEAVKSGVGLGGCHGGMCDAFRNNVGWQFMTGGQWVAHPGDDGVRYKIHIEDADHFITKGSKDFYVVSEQYYLHTDPANRVLATTEFPVADGPHTPNGKFKMPQVWTKMWGKGRVYYNALGHQANIVAQPEVLRLMVRGFLWAAKAEELATN